MQERAGHKPIQFPRQHLVRIGKLEDTCKDHGERIAQLEQFDRDLNEIANLLKKVAKYLKIGLPMVASAAVTSGIVSGKWGAFFAALFQQ